MGLTRNSKTFKTKETENITKENKNIIALLGNPNVGKTTLFNSLTGLRQHTGNWPGKTVSNAEGKLKIKNKTYNLIDLPGIYSLNAYSEEEQIAKDFIKNKDIDIILVVIDATSLERNLNLVLETKNIKNNIIICLNLLDEAKKKNINIDIKKLEKELNLPVIGMSARNKFGINKLIEKIENYKVPKQKDEYIINTEEKAKIIYENCVTLKEENYNKKTIKTDKILTSKKYGIPIMLLTLGIILWLTIIGANYPSELLNKGLFYIYDKLLILLTNLGINSTIIDFLLNGIYKVVAWVISVMLPPMAIFFPLFTLLEDLGYLPRIAFNMDKVFKKCGAHGKQSLTMCMGYGCNACGVIGCRIIESKKEKLIAILTNVFSPCNGRFPTLIAIISIFLVSAASNKFTSSTLSALTLLVLIIFSVLITLLISKILSKTILKGEPSSFTLELPPYRKPKILNTIIRSILDRTIFVLGRAIYISIPAGILIWLTANITINNVSILSYLSNFLEPLGSLIGLDGPILIAFLLGLPANEIVIPILLMAYTQMTSLTDYNSLTELKTLLSNNNWTIITAISFMIFTICHFPCGTTIMTIKKETSSIKWTLLSIIIPTITGLILCFIIANILKIFI
ncbi:MAG: ferrous iron transporter B [Bacilli bacterium]